ncbi:MAG: ABC transporter permease [Actinomycetota bacterium]|nr:ABC transporter permease [Actinomycetota bacterium]
MAQVGTTEQPVTAGGRRPAGGEITADVVGRSPGQLFWRRFRKDRFALAGVIVIVVIVLLAIAAPYIERHIAGHDKNNVDLHSLDEFGLPGGPSGQYWFGVDEAGRDLFVRVIYGARTSLTIAVVATGMSVVIGVVLGLLSGFYRGKLDTFISRFTDVVLSLPVLLLALGLVSACGISKEGCFGGLLKPGLTLVAIVIGLFSWPYISRIVRGQVLSLREKEFVEASRSLGASNWRIVFREILPNVAAPIIVYSTLIIPNNVLFEASLSFLGVGVPQETPSWGRMLSDASGHIESWWMMLFPGLFLLMTTLAFNLVGDGLRDALDPRDSR